MLDWFFNEHGWQFLLGMFLGYYVMSPRLRSWLRKGIAHNIRLLSSLKQERRSKLLRPNPDVVIREQRQDVIEKEREWQDVTFDGVPAETVSKPNHRAKGDSHISLDGKREVIVEDIELEEWMSKNPELRRLNGV